MPLPDFGFEKDEDELPSIVDVEAPSLIRDSDAKDYEHGVVGQFKKSRDLLNSQADIHGDKAMEMLKKTLANQREIRPSQGLAAALLATIPTIGGAMIGRSVGRAKIPEGAYFEGVSPSEFKKVFGGSGTNVGGAEGAALGQKVSTDYLGGLQAELDKQLPVYKDMAKVELGQADDLRQRALQLEQAGLSAQNQRELIPLQEESRIREINAQAKARQRYPSASEAEAKQALDPAQKSYWAKKLAIPEDLLATKGDLDRAIASSRYEDINDRNEQRRTDQEAATNIPGTTKLPGARPTSQSAEKARVAVTNYNQLKGIVIPELKRVFTDPNVTIDDQSAALAGAVMAIKNQQAMGANFTQLEEDLVKAGLPRIAEIKVGSMVNFLRAELQGQDPLKKIARLEDITNSSVEASIQPYGYTIGVGTGVSPSMSEQPSQPSGVPSVGGTFQGKKVLSVKKVK